MKKKIISEKLVILGVIVIFFTCCYLAGRLMNRRVERQHQTDLECARIVAHSEGFAAGIRATLKHVKITGTNASVDLADVLAEDKP